MKVSATVTLAQCAAGCNPVTHAAAWSSAGLIGFASNEDVVLCDSELLRTEVVLQGHRARVNCLHWLDRDGSGVGKAGASILLSGSSDGTLCIWLESEKTTHWVLGCALEDAHSQAINCLAGAPEQPSSPALVVSASADPGSPVRVWRCGDGTEAGWPALGLCQTLCVGAGAMEVVALVSPAEGQLLLVCGGVDCRVYVFAKDAEREQFAAACRLGGHTDWVRSLDLVVERAGSVLLASASQDRSVRVWRLEAQAGGARGGSSGADAWRLLARGPQFALGGSYWHATLDAVLHGHEDWVTAVRWRPGAAAPCLLSASMDCTALLWEQRGRVWLSESALGELGVSVLGFLGASWNSAGNAILAHAWGGALHCWRLLDGSWQPQALPLGHSGPVRDIDWDPSGELLLSVSQDKTARIFAQQAEGKGGRWQEVARPQVHGHALHCATWVCRPSESDPLLYVSGGEEKVLRVFQAPSSFFSRLSGTAAAASYPSGPSGSIVSAAMAPLGLSQRPILGRERGQGAQGPDAGDPELAWAAGCEAGYELVDADLAQQTLWAETHKLYGHGSDVSCVAVNASGTLVASACKAQGAVAAEIWLWETKHWQAVGQLRVHSLTVTQLEFSPTDPLLLSVSRDRHVGLSVVNFGEAGEFDAGREPVHIEAHKRIVWCCSWSPDGRECATGSRDKAVKVWGVPSSGAEGDVQIELRQTLPLFPAGVTAMAYKQMGHNFLGLAVGLESGAIHLWYKDGGGAFQPLLLTGRDMAFRHCGAISRLRWRPDKRKDKEDDKSLEERPFLLSSCSQDGFVKSFNIDVPLG